MKKSSIINILLIEDNPGDIDLTLEAFQKTSTPNNVFVVEDGEEAIAFLKKEGQYENMCTPDIILLDLNLPKIDGRTVLAEIKSDESLKHIPVIVLTTSKSEDDILKSYKLHANCYISKPTGIKQFWEMVSYIESFWFKIVRLPS